MPEEDRIVRRALAAVRALSEPDWTPSQIIEGSPRKEPSKPSKLASPPKNELSKPSKMSFEGFEGPIHRETQIIQGPQPAMAESKSDCPYHLPEGVSLVRYAVKQPPVAVTVCSVVTDVPKFIRHSLAELDARLHHPVQLRADNSVFDLLSKLADCGLELRLVWPPEARIIDGFPETEPSKPSKGPDVETEVLEITDEDTF